MIKSRLKILLAEHEMTQSQLTEITGIRPGTVTNIVNNKIKQIPVEALEKICNLFNCDVGDVFRYVPDPPEEK